MFFPVTTNPLGVFLFVSEKVFPFLHTELLFLEQRTSERHLYEEVLPDPSETDFVMMDAVTV